MITFPIFFILGQIAVFVSCSITAKYIPANAVTQRQLQKEVRRHVQWVRNNAGNFGGDPEKITVVTRTMSVKGFRIPRNVTLAVTRVQAAAGMISALDALFYWPLWQIVDLMVVPVAWLGKGYAFLSCSKSPIDSYRIIGFDGELLRVAAALQVQHYKKR